MLRALLTGLGAGATAMYFFDPVRGEARRAACSAKIGGYVQELNDACALLQGEAAAGVDRLVGTLRGEPGAFRAAHAAADEPAPPEASALTSPRVAERNGEEPWSPAAEAALRVAGAAVAGRLVLGRAFWPVLLGGGGLYWAAKQGAFEELPAGTLRDFGRSVGESLGGRVRGWLPGGLRREIGEIMSTDVAWCTSDAPLSEAARLMREHDCGAIPVVDDGVMRRPVGVVTDRDIAVRVVAEGRNLADVKVRDCMSTPAATAHRSASLSEVMRMMEDSKLRRVVIVDDDGRVCGIVAQADLAREAPQQQVGEVVREVSEPQGV